MSDLWPWYAKVATAAEGQNAEPGDPVQKMYECVYATTAVCLMVLGYPDTEPTDLMNLVHPGGHTGGEDYGVVAQFLRSHPQRWPNLPTIVLVNPSDTLGYLHSALAAGYAMQMDVKDDRNANVVQQWPVGWQGTHSVIVTGDDGGQIWIWNPWAGDRQHFSYAYFQQAALNPAGNFMVFQRDLRVSQQEEGMTLDDLVRIWYWIAFGRDPSAGEKANIINNNTSTNGPGQFAQLLADPEAKAHWAKVMGTAVQGPKGDKGDKGEKGDPGQAAAAPVIPATGITVKITPV